jgi:hypothetical protein
MKVRLYEGKIAAAVENCQHGVHCVVHCAVRCSFLGTDLHSQGWHFPPTRAGLKPSLNVIQLHTSWVATFLPNIILN